MNSFTIAALPSLKVGQSVLEALPEWLSANDHTAVLLIIGGSSFERSGNLRVLLDNCEKNDISCRIERVGQEPSCERIDAITARHFPDTISCVAGIGGGSVIDAAKAVAAMIAESRTAGRTAEVKDFLEGVGTQTPSGARIALAAVPTTSGTGSEATKNAVISSVGENGFKKSLRHDAYVPDAAFLDGRLLTSCPKDVSTYAGLDALTQLIESYVSKKANAFTDALCLSGITKAAAVLEGIFTGELAADHRSRTDMAYAAYLSGVTLANANLGVVHGAASVLGGYRHIPHGALCGTLLYPACRIITEQLSTAPAGEASKKYSDAGYLLAGLAPAEDLKKGISLLLERLRGFQETFDLPLLSDYGFTAEELKMLAKRVGIKETPADLKAEQIEAMLLERL